MGSRAGPGPGQRSTRLLALKPPPWTRLDPAEAPGKQPQTLALLSPRWMPRSPRTLWDPRSPRSDHGPQAIHPPLDLPCRGRRGQAWSGRTRCDLFHETSQVRASLVAQWLRICLLMQGIRVRALVWEDPTCRGATRPVSHNYRACASGASAPQQERPRQ